ncbi:hypothetical protein V5799_015614 [Amblyomma americanum]|uniref:Uncharacterized protein n=1 Tax=Amblyomma americanum TaxID=6943 RepID=A0AAQ4F8R7_AMBAM
MSRSLVATVWEGDLEMSDPRDHDSSGTLPHRLLINRSLAGVYHTSRLVPVPSTCVCMMFHPCHSHESPWKTFLCATSAFVAFTIATAVILFYFRRSPAVRSLVKFGTSAPGMSLRMACVEDGDCQEEANLVCGSEDGFDRVCLCDSGFVEEGGACAESPSQPGEPCDGRLQCAKRSNMVCDHFLRPPRCDCMGGTLWQENKCVALFGECLLSASLRDPPVTRMRSALCRTERLPRTR